MMSAVWLVVALLADPAVVRTSIRGSIEASLARKVGPEGAALAAQVARLLRWRGDVVRNVQPRDDLRLVYEPGDPPQLIGLAYHGQQITLLAYQLADSGGVKRYYDESGTLIEPVLINPPVADYVQITEVMQRGPGKRRHTGLDLKAEAGTPVQLPFAGRVTRKNWLVRVNGKCVEVVFDNGTLARFLHLRDVDPQVIRGKRLSAGARIGSVGSTGRSLAPHLHYDLRSAKGTLLDPLQVHGTQMGHVPETRQAAFEAARTQIDRALGLIATVSGAAR
jgi:murein DD-endopeptidase MepM/ murein hydrolase activator NlpD